MASPLDFFFDHVLKSVFFFLLNRHLTLFPDGVHPAAMIPSGIVVGFFILRYFDFVHVPLKKLRKILIPV
jgi:hypothetical protein